MRLGGVGVELLVGEVGTLERGGSLRQRATPTEEQSSCLGGGEGAAHVGNPLCVTHR